MKLSEIQAKPLCSRMKAWNLVLKDGKECLFLYCQEEYQGFFSIENIFVHCNNICALTDAIENERKTKNANYFFLR